MFYKTFFRSMVRWFDTSVSPHEENESLKEIKKVDWFRILPFVLLHLGCLGVIWVGISPVAVFTALGLFWIRIFAITGFYHRYFSHKTFKTSRTAQFLFALLGLTAVQRGPLWWAAHHRNHHRFSDQPEDAHSPRQYGFWWAHIGWITNRRNFPTRMKLIPDLGRFPELVFLNRFDTLVPILLAVFLFALGKILQIYLPSWGTSGPQMLVWGFFISTVVLFHATGSINSLSHQFGRQRFQTGDDSRNNLWLALLTFGEGWHNNHHKYPATPRQGFYWWEIDITYYILKGMERLGLIWDLKPVPEWVYEEAEGNAKKQEPEKIFVPKPAWHTGK